MAEILNLFNRESTDRYRSFSWILCGWDPGRGCQVEPVPPTYMHANLPVKVVGRVMALVRLGLLPRPDLTLKPSRSLTHSLYPVVQLLSAAISVRSTHCPPCPLLARSLGIRAVTGTVGGKKSRNVLEHILVIFG